MEIKILRAKWALNLHSAIANLCWGSIVVESSQRASSESRAGSRSEKRKIGKSERDRENRVGCLNWRAGLLERDCDWWRVESGPQRLCVQRKRERERKAKLRLPLLCRRALVCAAGLGPVARSALPGLWQYSWLVARQSTVDNRHSSGRSEREQQPGSAPSAHYIVTPVHNTYCTL